MANASPEIQILTDYLKEISTNLHNQLHNEDSYQPLLVNLVTELIPELSGVTQPKVEGNNKPDILFYESSNPDLIRGYGETKKPETSNLDSIEHTNQLERYFSAYPNLFLTNFLEFRFYQDAQPTETFILGIRQGTKVTYSDETVLEEFVSYLKEFFNHKPAPITNPQRLAQTMAHYAQRIRGIIEEIMQPDTDEEVTDDSLASLQSLFFTLQSELVPDLDIESFADMYAQSLVYSLFIARYNQQSQGGADLTRYNAPTYIPQANRVLRQVFNHIVDSNFPQELVYPVTDLLRIFNVSDLHAMLHTGDKDNKDPVVYFYENFLTEYDKTLKEAMGVWYTPLPIVRFMIRRVDALLKEQLNVKDGLLNEDTVQTEFTMQAHKPQGKGNFKVRTSEMKNVAQIQILDPAAGTSTFMSQIIQYAHSKFVENGNEGMWKDFLEDSLMRRLFGFEIMISPYTIGHLKVAQTIADTGVEDFQLNVASKVNLYLTDSLDGAQPSVQELPVGQTVLQGALNEEANEAAFIKAENPLQVVIGNPPYNGQHPMVHSAYSNDLIDAYRFETDGSTLNASNQKGLHDDYVKFIAFAEKQIEQTGQGIVALITNSTYLTSIPLRGMRNHLLKTFDDIYIYDLFGEQGTEDSHNVFGIQVGVCIFIGVKHPSQSTNFATVHYTPIHGATKDKFVALDDDNKGCETVSFTPQGKNVFFIPLEESTTESVPLTDLFVKQSTAIDPGSNIFAKFTEEETLHSIHPVFRDGFNEDYLMEVGNVGPKSRNLPPFKKKIEASHFDEGKIAPLQFAPLDNRFIYLDNIIAWPRWEVTRPLTDIPHNFALAYSKGTNSEKYTHIFSSAIPTYFGLLGGGAKENAVIAPLWRKDSEGNITSNIFPKARTTLLSNLSSKPSDEELFYYIYGVLHSPSYRATYNDRLRLQPPEIPVIPNDEEFERIMPLGKRLLELHTQTVAPAETIGKFPKQGDNTVQQTPTFNNGKIWINDEQYFEGASKDGWNFTVKKPVLKNYLNSRKYTKIGRRLNRDELNQFLKNISIVEETIQLMKEIG